MLFLPLLALTLAQTGRLDTYGKTDSQILAMGGAKWVNFYTSKATSSTADMNEAWNYYCDLAGKRNFRITARLPVKQQQTFHDLEKFLGDFASSVEDVGRGISGGGTIWTTIGAMGDANVQDALHYVLRPSEEKAPKHVVTSQVEKGLKTLIKGIDGIDFQASDIPSKPELRKEIEHSRKVFTHITEIASKFPRNASDRILGFCIDEIQTALQE